MPPSDLPQIILVTLRHALPFIFQQLHNTLLALHHRLTYTPSASSNPPSPPPIIIIGASFAGHQVALRLAQTLPSPHRVILIERRTHLHWVFGFPRFSVVPGYEACAMVPYEGGPLEQGWSIPKGVLERMTGEVVEVIEREVVVRCGRKSGDGYEQEEEEEEVILPFSALVVATGCEQDRPARLQSLDLERACAELRAMQERVKTAQRIAVVGGGAVGVELASDIKDYYSDKSVTLVHSRTQLLSGFGERLHEHALSALEGLGVKVVLGERPVISNAEVDADVGVDDENKDMKEKRKPTLTFPGGGMEEFDLIIPCTGQRPNSSLFTSLSPSSISPSTRRILVNDRLQVRDATGRVTHPHIFALGDVADTGGPRMARAAMFQAEVVVKNILSLISEKEVKETYRPRVELEGAIKLTLGIKQFAMWMRDESKGRELMISSGKGREDMGVAQAWSWYGSGKKDMPERREL